MAEGRRQAVARCRPATLIYACRMHPIVLLSPLSDLRHSPTDGFSDSPEAFTYKGSSAVVRFDKATATVTLDPPGADVLVLLQELQALATAQHDQDKARILARLRQRRAGRDR